MKESSKVTRRNERKTTLNYVAHHTVFIPVDFCGLCATLRKENLEKGKKNNVTLHYKKADSNQDLCFCLVKCNNNKKILLGHSIER